MNDTYAGAIAQSLIAKGDQLSKHAADLIMEMQVAITRVVAAYNSDNDSSIRELGDAMEELEAFSDHYTPYGESSEDSDEEDDDGDD